MNYQFGVDVEGESTIQNNGINIRLCNYKEVRLTRLKNKKHKTGDNDILPPDIFKYSNIFKM